MTVRPSWRRVLFAAMMEWRGSDRAVTRRTASAMSVLHLDRQADPFLQRFVNRDASLRPLGSSHDGELHVARCVADDIDAGHTCLAKVVRLDGSLSCELASQSLSELRLLRLRQRKEHRAARHGVGRGIERQSICASVLVFQTFDALGSDHDAALRKLCGLTPTETGGTMRAERDALAPRLQGEGESSGVLAAPDHGKRFVTMLPSVAVRAVMDADSVTVIDARDSWQLIADAGGEQDGLGLHPFRCANRDREFLRFPLDGRHRCVSDVDSV